MKNLPPVPPAVRRMVALTGSLLVAVMAGLVVGNAVNDGLWFMVAGALAMPLGLTLAHRRPELVFAAWFLFDPLLMFVDGGGPFRKVYWLVHRFMPLVVLGLLVAMRITGQRRLPRLGLPEVLMGGYLAISLISIAYSSPTALATTYHLYDRVFVPMAMYLLVRLVAPTQRMLVAALPVLGILLTSQTLFGVLSWAAPGALPDQWLGRAGSRTTGSLGHPNVYGTTLLAAALVIFGVTMSGRAAKHHRLIGFGSLLLAVLGSFLTLSRAAWLAALLVVVGIASMYRKVAIRFVAAFVLVVGLFSMSPYAEATFDRIQRRTYSEQSAESALSRLPVMLASIRMFEERPLTGFGFGNFDYFDLQYQSSVGELYVPDKDHASHNLYLTLLAEQGLPGFLLYLGPALVWLARSRRAWAILPAQGIESRRFLGLLWLILGTHVIINNFSNMRIPFGLSVWWMTLGLIGVIVTRALRPEDIDRADLDESDFQHPLRARRLLEERLGVPR